MFLIKLNYSLFMAFRLAFLIYECSTYTYVYLFSIQYSLKVGLLLLEVI